GIDYTRRRIFDVDSRWRREVSHPNGDPRGYALPLGAPRTTKERIACGVCLRCAPADPGMAHQLVELADPSQLVFWHDYQAAEKSGDTNDWPSVLGVDG